MDSGVLEYMEDQHIALYARLNADLDIWHKENMRSKTIP